MMKKKLLRFLLLAAVLILSVFFLYYGVRLVVDSFKATLRFTIIQDRDVYEESMYGEPPQVAIWLEDSASGELRTVYVTSRTATGRFEGKTECPVSLPIWIGVFRREFGREDFPTPRKPAPSAITGATSKTELITAEVLVPPSSRWRYYIEMNVSGDFNRTYPEMSNSMRPDRHGNGQPSHVYCGEIVAEPGRSSSPKPVGRSRHYQFTDKIIPNLEGIKSSLEVFKSIEVQCVD
jgi:hypothetical protein